LDKDKGRPVLAAMITEGKVLRNNGSADILKQAALAFINQGPAPLTESYIQSSRYFMFDLLDDFIDANNREEALLTLNTLSIQLADFILRLNGQWSGRGKTLTRELKKFDEGLSEKFFDALNHYYEDNEKQPWVEFVYEIYRPLGGQLFAGFVMGKSQVGINVTNKTGGNQMPSNPFHKILTSEQEIRDLLGYPSEVVQRKTINQLDQHCRDFIALSPLLFVSTADDQGYCDVSPRGDAPGSVLVIDELHLVIPERPGNRRIDSLRNILKNPRIGLIFMIPGLEETLRINGKAFVIQDEEILSRMKVRDKQPILGIGVEVEECFIHCAKAFKRSGLWDVNSWVRVDSLPSIPAILSAHVNSTEYPVEVIKKGLQESYEKRLY
jgi:PPOX class probable FMN-dependent enzyme